VERMVVYLINPNSQNLEHLSLNNLQLRDEGLNVLGQGLYRRHLFMRNQKFQDYMMRSQGEVMDTEPNVNVGIGMGMGTSI
jgi:hypothetical protein